MKKGNKFFLRAIRYFLILFLLFLSFSLGAYLSERNKVISDLVEKQSVNVGRVLGKYGIIPEGKLIMDVDFDQFWEVWDTLKEQYVDQEKVTDKKIFYGALKGMVASLEDPYTVFMDPKVAKDFSDDLAGTFEGIGAEIGIKNNILTIIAPLPDMPAEKAGLMAGDLVLKIDGKSTVGIYIDEAVRQIRGEKGTDVTLSIAREGLDEMIDIVVTRGAIIVKSVYTKLRDDNIFVIEISNFNNDTEELFNKAVREIIELNPDGIILDLRNNPGGYLETAIEVASEWVEDGIVVTEKYSEERKTEHLARGRARLKGYKTVVLVNEGSASASEIVSGALKDYNLAVIAGEKTFGKGSVQTLTDFSDGSSIKITVAKWLTPSGRSINEDGVEPHIIVDYSLENYNNNEDPQMDKALDILENWDDYKEEIRMLMEAKAASSSLEMESEN